MAEEYLPLMTTTNLASNEAEIEPVINSEGNYRNILLRISDLN